MPNVSSRLKQHRLGLRPAFALEVMLEERELNIGSEVFAGFGVELNVAQMAALTPRPAAVYPRSLAQRGRRFRVEFIDRVEGAVGTGKVLGVIPSAHNKHGATHILHVARKVARHEECALRRA